jgi:hypothetical protein
VGLRALDGVVVHADHLGHGGSTVVDEAGEIHEDEDLANAGMDEKEGVFWCLFIPKALETAAEHVFAMCMLQCTMISAPIQLLIVEDECGKIQSLETITYL